MATDRKDDGLQDKVVVITGASGGIGAATATLLAERGATVVLAARSAERIEQTAEELRSQGRRSLAVATDITRNDDAQALVERTLEHFSRLDVLVNNAGIAPISRVDELRIGDWMAMLDVNLRGVLYGTAAALPVFRRQGFGHVVSIASVAGITTSPTMAVYAASKNAVRTFMEGLRTESTDGVIRTTTISPGFVRTDLPDSMDSELRDATRQRMSEFGLAPDAVARTVAFAIGQPNAVEISDLTIRPTVQD